MSNAVAVKRKIFIVKSGYGKVIRGDERCRREPAFAIRVDNITTEGGKEVSKTTTFYYNDGNGNPTNKGGLPFLSRGSARIASKKL